MPYNFTIQLTSDNSLQAQICHSGSGKAIKTYLFVRKQHEPSGEFIDRARNTVRDFIKEREELVSLLSCGE